MKQPELYARIQLEGLRGKPTWGSRILREATQANASAFLFLNPRQTSFNSLNRKVNALVVPLCISHLTIVALTACDLSIDHTVG